MIFYISEIIVILHFVFMVIGFIGAGSFLSRLSFFTFCEYRGEIHADNRPALKKPNITKHLPYDWFQVIQFLFPIVNFILLVYINIPDIISLCIFMA